MMKPDRKARTCSGLVYWGRFPRDCPRAATETLDGEWYCKPHAAGMRRRNANNAKRAVQENARADSDAVIIERIERLEQALGISIGADLDSRTFALRPRGIIALDDLERLADKLKGNQ